MINFYRWADTLWASKHMKHYNNYTEGKNDCDPHMSVLDSQLPKFEWMASQGKVGTGSRVLEIGCGNGEFMRYIESLGARITGLTPSPDQVALLKARGLDARLVDVWDIGSHTELHGQYDCVVMNGSTEHFMDLSNGRTESSQGRLLRRMFEMVDLCLDPHSASGRCVITAIHMQRGFSAYEYLQIYMLERTYGGFYAHTPESYVDSGRQRGFSLVTCENRTMDYYIQIGTMLKSLPSVSWYILFKKTL